MLEVAEEEKKASQSDEGEKPHHAAQVDQHSSHAPKQRRSSLASAAASKSSAEHAARAKPAAAVATLRFASTKPRAKKKQRIAHAVESDDEEMMHAATAPSSSAAASRRNGSRGRGKRRLHSSDDEERSDKSGNEESEYSEEEEEEEQSDDDEEYLSGSVTAAAWTHGHGSSSAGADHYAVMDVLDQVKGVFTAEAGVLCAMLAFRNPPVNLMARSSLNGDTLLHRAIRVFNFDRPGSKLLKIALNAKSRRLLVRRIEQTVQVHLTNDAGQTLLHMPFLAENYPQRCSRYDGYRKPRVQLISPEWLNDIVDVLVKRGASWTVKDQQG